MKHFLLVLTCTFLISFSVRAQYVTIPDVTFRNFLHNKYPSAFNASNMMDTSNSLIVNETMLNIPLYTDVIDWEGYQYFKNLFVAGFYNPSASLPAALPATLKQLIIDPGYPTSFTSLPGLPAGLTKLVCRWARNITALPALPVTLTYLDCWDCEQLQSIPPLPNSVVYLNCGSNFELHSLPVLSTSLKQFIFSGSQYITSLPALPGSLDTLVCSASTVTSLPALPASLTYLACNNDHLISLPALPATLKYLSCTSNTLTALPVLPSSLKYLHCRANTITSLPALPSLIEDLDVGVNLLTTLPALPAALLTLNAERNLLHTIPALPSLVQSITVSQNSINVLPALPASLTTLTCMGNLLTALPVLNAGLQILECENNHLHSLPALNQSLTTFYCGSNYLTTIPDLPESLLYFDCTYNQINSLPQLPSHLQQFLCSYNLLASLPALPGTLISIQCQGNYIMCMPVLPNGSSSAPVQMIAFDDKVTCIPNLPAHYYTIRAMHVTPGTFTDYNSSNLFPVCSVINNGHQCEAFPLMTGNIFYDANNNLVQDANEPVRPNVKVVLSNGNFTFTDINGNYGIATDNLGSYSTTTAQLPSYMLPVPLQYHYNFSSYDTIVTGNNFALKSTFPCDLVDISIIPINPWPRAGYTYPYVIAYENDGTNTLPISNIVVKYDNTKLIYDSSSNAAVIDNGTSLSLTEANLTAGSFIAYFRTKLTLALGDTILSTAEIHANTAAAYDTAIFFVMGSYDPNEKEATPSLTPEQVANGDYIYYTIRFQNTGNDTAFNVVVTDTLNSKLNVSTLEMLHTSHLCKTTVKNNAVSFEFINIMLPDSNINELKSHGFIRFRIKPMSNVTVNSTIPNKAAIYFDYNTPVITNTAVTTITNTIVVPLKLLSFYVSKAEGLNANVYWYTANEYNVKQYNIEMSTDGRNFTNAAVENAKGSLYNSYTRLLAIPENDVIYFRLKMLDIDGNYTYSELAVLRNTKEHHSFTFTKNPVTDLLTIELKDAELKNTMAGIYDAKGILVKRIMLQNDIENINVKSLPGGVYTLVTEKGSRQFVIVK